MRDLPEASFLLALAEEAPDCEAALAQRCRDIAEREERLGTARFEAIGAALADLYGPGEGEVTGLLARLAADIRAGRFDQPSRVRATIDRLLRQLVLCRLEESNPHFITDDYKSL